MTKKTLAEIFYDNFAKLNVANETSYAIAKRSGLTIPTIERIKERGAPPNLDTIDKLAAAYGIHAWELLTPKKQGSIPVDIANMLEDQPDIVYDTVRAMLGPLTKLKKKK